MDLSEVEWEDRGEIVSCGKWEKIKGVIERKVGPAEIIPFLLWNLSKSMPEEFLPRTIIIINYYLNYCTPNAGNVLLSCKQY